MQLAQGRENVHSSTDAPVSSAGYSKTRIGETVLINLVQLGS